MRKRCVKCGARLRTRRVARRGAGLGDWFRKKVAAVKDYFSPLKDQYTRGTAATLARFGSGTVTDVTVFRKPVAAALDKMLDLLSMGAFSAAKQKYGYEQFYHLGTVVTVALPGGGQASIIVEKLEVVNVAQGAAPTGKGAEYMQAPLPAQPPTLYAFLENTRAAMGDSEFFIYRALPIDGKPANNCQVFVRALLAANGMLTPELEGFVMQPIESLAAELPGYVKDTAQFLTDTAATARKVLGLGRRHAGSRRRAHWKRPRS